jgi:pteridine reductase
MNKRIVLVTGAAKRLGRTILERFAQDGYDVVVHYGNSKQDALNTVAAVEHIGREAIALKADLSCPDELTQMVARVYERFGRLDALVNCAGTFFPDHLSDFKLGDLEMAWQINCRAPILLTQAYYNQAKAHNQQGVVVNVVDQKVRGNFHPDDFSYTVSKVALGYLTPMLAVSSMSVLRVNAVYPGLISQSGDQTLEDFEHASKKSTPLGYIATPKDVADAVLLLTLPSFNGTDFMIDAGQNMVRVEHDVIALHRAPNP